MCLSPYYRYESFHFFYQYYRYESFHDGLVAKVEGLQASHFPKSHIKRLKKAMFSFFFFFPFFSFFLLEKRENIFVVPKKGCNKVQMVYKKSAIKQGNKGEKTKIHLPPPILSSVNQ